MKKKIRNDFSRFESRARTFYSIHKHNLNVLINRARHKQKGDSFDTLLVNVTKSMLVDLYYYHGVSLGNNYYGIERTLSGYSGLYERISAPIEHGVYFGSYVNMREADPSSFPCVVTFGESRCRHIQHMVHIPVMKTGPYIKYANMLLSADELKTIKESLGKVLLVFPCHATDTVGVERNVDNFLAQVDSFAKSQGIDSILFCLYFMDIINGLGEYLTQTGRTYVCAGHRSDPLFLSRLKSIMLLSDLSVSDGVGTHIGYSECLQIPHYIIPSPAKKNVEQTLFKTCKQYDLHSKRGEELEVEDAFSLKCGFDYSRRKQIVNKYWGSPLGKKEMKKAFQAINSAYYFMRTERLSSVQALEAALGSDGLAAISCISMPQH